MTYQELAEAIQTRIVGMWPERAFYRDFCPSDFARPSCFLAVTRAAPRDANAGLAEWAFEAELTLFCATGAYDAQSAEALIRDQEAVLALFGPGWLRVGDRAVPLAAAGEAPEAGEAYVRFSASWFAPRTGAEPASAPTAEGYGYRVGVESAKGK